MMCTKKFDNGYICMSFNNDMFCEFSDVIHDDSIDFTYSDFTGLFVNNNAVIIHEIYINKNARRCGNGTSIMYSAIEYIKNTFDSEIIYLNASPIHKSNMSMCDLRKFYEKIGFKAIKKLDIWHGSCEMIYYI